MQRSFTKPLGQKGAFKTAYGAFDDAEGTRIVEGYGKVLDIDTYDSLHYSCLFDRIVDQIVLDFVKAEKEIMGKGPRWWVGWNHESLRQAVRDYARDTFEEV